MNWLTEYIQKEITPDDLVLDLGCGIMTVTNDLKCKSILGVDHFPPYLQIVSKQHSVIWHNLESNMLTFASKSFDVVLALDILEHLELSKAQNLLLEMKRICRKKVIAYTPSKLDKNESSVENAWDLGRNESQAHKCLITKEEFELWGYKAKIIGPDHNWLAIYNQN